MVIDATPPAMSESTYQQQKGGLGLMEIGKKVIDDLKIVARCDDDLRRAVEFSHPLGIKPSEQGTYGLAYLLARRVHGMGKLVVRLPLAHMKESLGWLRLRIFNFQSHVEKALQRSHAGSSYSDGLTVMTE